MGYVSPELICEDNMPALHPEKQEGNNKSAFYNMLMGEGVPAHVSPEIEKSENKRQRSYVITREIVER